MEVGGAGKLNNSCQPFGSIRVSYMFNKKRTKYDHWSKSRKVPCIRPYHVENTSSRPITEVKQHWAMLVLGWVTAWEYMVLYSFFKHISFDNVEFLGKSLILAGLEPAIP